VHRNAVGEIPQNHGVVETAGGQGMPVRGKRHRLHRARVAGERLTEATRLVAGDALVAAAQPAYGASAAAHRAQQTQLRIGCCPPLRMQM
jgi:hypothetical protein